MINEIRGNLLDTHCKIIAHGVNCQNIMGSGVARALYEKWPQVKELYHSWFEKYDAGDKGIKALGQVDDLHLKSGKVIINCFTQQFYGTDNIRYLSYDALYTCMTKLYLICVYYQINEIAMPKIGCGLAGGEWPIVKAIIEEVFPKNFTVNIYIKE